jgi:tetratricopeptide (TPR) repeat protein
MKLKTLCMALFLITNYALAQDPWESYKPRTLKQIIQQHESELVTERGQAKAVLIFSAEPFKSRVKVIYTGESRIVSAKRKELIVDWVKSFRYKPETADLFESELLFKEGSVEHWLPVQKQVIPYFAQELKKGDEVTLLLVWAGARRDPEQTDWVFLVNEFEATDQQPGASQKSGGDASLQDAEIAKLIKEGLAREDAGDLKGAIEINQKILQLDPRNIYAMNMIAGLLGKLGEFEQEMAWAQKAIAINPQFDLAYINKGNALAGLKRYNEAAEAFNKAIRINPKDPLGIYSLGVLEEEQGNFKKALEFYRQSIQIDPKFENGYFNLAAMHANLKQFDEAIAALKKLIELNPQSEDAKAMLRQIEKER